MDMPRHNGTRCKEMIIEILEEDYKPLFIDEADRLSIDRIEDLRDIFEMTGVPIVLIGEEGIWGLLRERRRIMSRVAHEVEFSPISPVEVSLFLNNATDLLIPADLCQRITKQADGDFRIVRNKCSLMTGKDYTHVNRYINWLEGKGYIKVVGKKENSKCFIAMQKAKKQLLQVMKEQLMP